ncbi:hypothetical protein EJV44_04655 [Ancylobacter aquaticus]|nr:hypothetical protein EJV44_04655 [Ancylobacter aquaticus]
MRLVASLFALCLLTAGIPASGAIAALATPAQQELIMATPDTTVKKTRATKAAEKAKADTAADVAAETNTSSDEQTGSVDGTLPSTGRGEIAASIPEGQPTVPAHSDGMDAEAQEAQPEPIEGAQVPADESTAFVAPSPETGEIEEAEAAAASSIDTPAPDLPRLVTVDLKLNVNEHIFEGTLVVSGPPEGRRRAGMRFSPTPTPIRAEDLTSDQLAALYADPLLTIRC